MTDSLFYTREWRNWYTRKIKDLMPQGLGVRVPPRALSFAESRES